MSIINLCIEFDAEMGHNLQNAIKLLNEHGYRATPAETLSREAVEEILGIPKTNLSVVYHFDKKALQEKADRICELVIEKGDKIPEQIR